MSEAGKAAVMKLLANGDFKVISGDSPPSDLIAQLKAMVKGKDGDPPSAPEPLTPDECFAIFFDAEWQPKKGDLVELRPEWACKYSIPLPGQRCVVTQVFNPALHAGNDGSPDFAVNHDIAIAFKSNHGGPDGEPHYHYIEHAYDSRCFRKLGTMNDKIEGEA